MSRELIYPAPRQVQIFLSRGNTVCRTPAQEENVWKICDDSANATFCWQDHNGVSVLTMEAAAPMINTFVFNPVFCSPCAMKVHFDLENYDSHMALYQHKIWWMRPSFGAAAEKIPEQTQLLVLKRGDEYEVFLTYTDRQIRTDISGTENGIDLTISTSVTNHDRLSGLVMLWGKGQDPYALTERFAEAVQDYTGGKLLLRGQKAFPAIFEGEGWCSWDSMGRDVSEQLLIEKMEELREKGHEVSWVLIDDGWSETNQQTEMLTGFGADPVRFPGGLRQTVRILKEQYGVKYVGVWQAVKGYWHGIERGSAAHEEMAEHLMTYGNGELSYKPDAGSAFAFWSRWHGQLRADGIDFVKIDGQSSFQDMVAGYADCGETLEQMYEGMEASVFLHFGGNLINCMGMGPENIWKRTYSALSRTSDDYLPRDLASFPEHARQNAYSSILHGELYYGDWDMFWSSHPDALKSILLRMISGGPLYTSDGIGKSDAAVLAPAVGDHAEILRCTGIGRPTLDCLTAAGGGQGQSRRVLKMFNTSAYNSFNTAVFDLGKGDEPAQDSIDLKDIPGLTADAYFVYDWKKQTLGRVTKEKVYSFELGESAADIFSLIPDSGEAVTILGLTDKYIPMAGILEIWRGERECEITAKCAGTLSVIIHGRTEIVKGSEAVQEIVPAADAAESLIEIPIPKGGCSVKIRN